MFRLSDQPPKPTEKSAQRNYVCCSANSFALAGLASPRPIQEFHAFTHFYSFVVLQYSFSINPRTNRDTRQTTRESFDKIHFYPKETSSISMYKHHFISALTRVQRLVVLVGLLTFLLGSQHVSAQSQLAQDTYAIFEGSCLICHGPDGAYRETLLMEHDALIGGGTVVPGNPNASELYKRLLGTTENGGAQMPLGQPPLPPQSIDTIRRWILAGAPDWTAAPITTRRFIPPSEVLKAIDSHVKTISPFDRPYARYFTMTHRYIARQADREIVAIEMLRFIMLEFYQIVRQNLLPHTSRQRPKPRIQCP